MIPTVDNVISIYRRATVRQYQLGRDWYPFAYRIAKELDPHNPDRAAGIIAALSPMQQWHVNEMFARRTYELGYACGNTFANRAKAQRIWDGEDPLDVLTSNKVRNFYLNISNPYTSDGVTIDRHAFDIAVGQVTDDKARASLSRKGVYQSYSDVYRAAAILFNMPPCVMQAVTWVTWREEKEQKRVTR